MVTDFAYYGILDIIYITGSNGQCNTDNLSRCWQTILGPLYFGIESQLENHKVIYLYQILH